MPQPFEFRGVVRFTKIGTTYLVTTIVLAVAAINTGNNALYIGVSLMLGSLLLSGIASKGGLKHLHVEIGGIGEAWAGRPAEGTLQIRNDSFLWNVRDVVLTSDVLAEPVLVPMLPRRAKVDVEASFLFTRRGLAHVTAIDSYTRYPFGFFLKKRRLPVTSEVVVFPRILAEEGPADRFRNAWGEMSSSNRPGPGTDIHSFRDYVRGDSLRHVHWKKSASLGRWVMKQTDIESSRSVHVLVDPYKPKTASEEDLEAMISAAATYIYQAAREEFDIILSLPRVTLRVREHESATPLFRALALLEPVFEPVHQIVERNTVVFAIPGARSDAA